MYPYQLSAEQHIQDYILPRNFGLPTIDDPDVVEKHRNLILNAEDMIDILLSGGGGRHGHKCVLVRHLPEYGPSSLDQITYLQVGHRGWFFNRYETVYAGAVTYPDAHITEEMIAQNEPIGTRCGFRFWPFPGLKCAAYSGWVTWTDIPSEDEYRFYVIATNGEPIDNPFSAPDSGRMQSARSLVYDLTSSSSSTDSTSSGGDGGSGSSSYVYEAHQSLLNSSNSNPALLYFPETNSPTHGNAFLLEKVVNVTIGEQEETIGEQEETIDDD